MKWQREGMGVCVCVCVSVNVVDEPTEKTGEEGPEQGLVTWSPH